MDKEERPGETDLVYPAIVYCILTAASKLGMYSGVLALGIGDSMAAMAGKLIGRFKWPGIYCIHGFHVLKGIRRWSWL